MLFDVQTALAEILSTPAATAATIASPPPKIASVSLKSRVSQSQPAENVEDDGDTFRHGRAYGPRAKTWTGRVVNLEEWRNLSAWDRHGPDGRLWCGICQSWLSNFPDCHNCAASGRLT